MFILGGFAVTSGLLTIAFLPETLGAGLPEVKYKHKYKYKSSLPPVSQSSFNFRTLKTLPA